MVLDFEQLQYFSQSGIWFQYKKILKSEKIDDELEDFVCHKWSVYNKRKHIIYAAIILFAILVCIGKKLNPKSHPRPNSELEIYLKFILIYKIYSRHHKK